MRNKLHSGPPATLKGEVAKTNVALNTLFYILSTTLQRKNSHTS